MIAEGLDEALLEKNISPSVTISSIRKLLSNHRACAVVSSFPHC